jgi:3-carboxy-cis,cis-muconate cycloisomerase
MAIPEIFVLAAGVLHQAKFALSGLIVDEKKMADNLDISRGLIVAEAVMMGLAREIGRQDAHDVVYDACRLANEKGITLADALVADQRVSARIDRATIDRLTAPKNYLGLAPQMVDRVLAASSRCAGGGYADFASSSPCPSRTKASNVFGFAPPICSIVPLTA